MTYGRTWGHGPSGASRLHHSGLGPQHPSPQSSYLCSGDWETLHYRPRGPDGVPGRGLQGEISEPEQLVLGELCAHTPCDCPSLSTKQLQGHSHLPADALLLEISCPGLSGVQGPRRKGVWLCQARFLMGATAVAGARAPVGGPRMRCSLSPVLWCRSKLGLGAPTLGDTTLMSSLRKRNLPTSSWNLLPQLFMHVSSTWGRWGGGPPGRIRGGGLLPIPQTKSSRTGTYKEGSNL